MKRQRRDFATCPLPPLTAAELERHLDFLALLMDGAGKNAEGFLPIWRMLERHLEKRREAEALLAAAKARLTRSRDRMAAQSS